MIRELAFSKANPLLVMYLQLLRLFALGSFFAISRLFVLDGRYDQLNRYFTHTSSINKENLVRATLDPALLNSGAVPIPRRKPAGPQGA